MASLRQPGRFLRGTSEAERAAARDRVGDLVPLFTEVGDAKRVRVAHAPGSLAERAFRRSWAALCRGEAVESVARRESARAVAAARLGGLDAGTLLRAGLPKDEVVRVLRRSFDAVAEPVPEPLRSRLREFLVPEPEEREGSLSVPDFVQRLARQPRAGCTRPGRPRLVLEPPENHAEHCMTVAVYAVLLSEEFGAEPGRVFLAGLIHHLHNAGMPDSGFTGEALLGDKLGAVMDRYREEALAELEASGGAELRRAAEREIREIETADGPTGRAFHAADVLDRVLQMHHYAREASFTVDQALEEMDLVHDGPVKSFHESVLARANLTPANDGSGR